MLTSATRGETLTPNPNECNSTLTSGTSVAEPPPTVFPRINARGVYLKIRDFRGRSFEGAFIRGGAFISKFQK